MYKGYRACFLKKSSLALVYLCEGLPNHPFGASACDVYFFMTPFADRHAIRLAGLERKQGDPLISVMALYVPT